MFYFVFPVRGVEVARKHEYYLFSAISQIIDIHDRNPKERIPIQITPITGVNNRDKIKITNKSYIKIIGISVKEANQLQNKVLNINGNLVCLGSHILQSFEYSPSLFCRSVVLKDCFEPEKMAAEIKKLFSENAKIEIGKKTFIKIKNVHKIGFQVKISNLDLNESINIQRYGVGMMRNMGCGNFYPVK